MADLIDRQAAIALAKDICVPIKDGTVYKHRCIDPDAIKGLPSVQTDQQECEKCIFQSFKQFQPERKTGRWKITDLPKGKMKYCSECGFGQYIADERQYRFCPNCGARMEEQE